MSSPAGIPQHPLRNKTGAAISFEWLTWGTVHNYDFLKAHRHQFHEIMFFETGQAKHDIDFHTYEAGPRSVHFVGCDSVHLVVREPGSTGYSLLFTTDFLPSELIDQLPFSKTRPVISLSESDHATITRLTQQIYAEHQEQAPYSEKILKSLMEALMLHLVRICNMQLPDKLQSALPEHLQVFQQMVKEHYLDHFSVEHYANEIGLSPKHLIELCKKHLGKTPLKYIQEHTVCEAKRLLYHTQSSIKEIAYQLNFDDPANFSKYFKANTGYTPATYRRDNTGK